MRWNMIDVPRLKTKHFFSAKFWIFFLVLNLCNTKTQTFHIAKSQRCKNLGLNNCGAFEFTTLVSPISKDVPRNVGWKNRACLQNTCTMKAMLFVINSLFAIYKKNCRLLHVGWFMGERPRMRDWGPLTFLSTLNWIETFSFWAPILHEENLAQVLVTEKTSFL